LREGSTANRVGHPGVVRVLGDDVADDGSAYIVMELLTGGELLEDRRERLGGRLPVDEVVRVSDQVLDVLAAAHEKGVIHRDIKPENIYVLGDGTVKVLDFGIAHIKEAAIERTATGLVLGSPEYMSPEQALGKRGQIDAQTDLYALGATMFTLLSGEAVHVHDALAALLVAVSSRQARSLASVAFKEIPRPLIAVVDKALMLEKHRRWPSARAMQAALRAAVPVEPARRTAPSVARPVRSDPPPSSSPTLVDEPPRRASSSVPSSIPPPSEQTKTNRLPATGALPPTSAAMQARAGAKHDEEQIVDSEDVVTQEWQPDAQEIAKAAARRKLSSNPLEDVTVDDDLEGPTVSLSGSAPLPARRPPAVPPPRPSASAPRPSVPAPRPSAPAPPPGGSTPSVAPPAIHLGNGNVPPPLPTPTPTPSQPRALPPSQAIGPDQLRPPWVKPSQPFGPLPASRVEAPTAPIVAAIALAVLLLILLWMGGCLWRRAH
jgi:serine/threonine-protein kinase